VIKKRDLYNFLKLYKPIFGSLHSVKTINIEATSHCNQKCAFCSTGTEQNPRTKGTMSFDTFKLLVDQLTEKTELKIAGYGEPFINKELEVCLAYAMKNNHYVKVFTNLAAVNEKRMKAVMDIGIQQMIISLDAMDKEAFMKYKQVDQFDRVIKNLEKLHKIQEKIPKKTEIIVKMVINNYNETTVDEFSQYIKSLGFTPSMAKLSVALSEASDEQVIEFTHTARKNAPEKKEKKYSKNCAHIWGSMIVYWNGDISVCGQDPDGHHIHGNLHQDDIWKLFNHSKARQKFRERYYQDPSQNDICRNCSSA